MIQTLGNREIPTNMQWLLKVEERNDQKKATSCYRTYKCSQDCPSMSFLVTILCDQQCNITINSGICYVIVLSDFSTFIMINVLKVRCVYIFLHSEGGQITDSVGEEPLGTKTGNKSRPTSGQASVCGNSTHYIPTKSLVATQLKGQRKINDYKSLHSLLFF